MANTLNLIRNGAVGFIDRLDLVATQYLPKHYYEHAYHGEDEQEYICSRCNTSRARAREAEIHVIRERQTIPCAQKENPIQAANASVSGGS